MKTKFTFLFLMLIFLQSCFVSQKSLYNEEKNGNATITKVNVPMFLVKPFIKKTLREDGSSEDVINLIKKNQKSEGLRCRKCFRQDGSRFFRKNFRKQYAGVCKHQQ